MSASSHDQDALLELALGLARAAGELLLERFGGPPSGVSAKTTRTDLVSDADRDAEALILARLTAARPGDAIVAEEGGASFGHGGLSWLVDPLDGTINYLWGIPHWSVSVAAADDAGPLVGVVHDSCRGETFSALRGGGAWLGETRLQLDPGPPLEEALIGTGFNYDAAERARQAARLTQVLPAVRDLRRYGSAALDLAWVAAGRLDGYFETGLNAWDWAAGRLLVAEAGGTVWELPAAGGSPGGVGAARPGLAEPLAGLLGRAGTTAG